MSVSKKSEHLLDAPASIYVITRRISGDRARPVSRMRCASSNLEVSRVNSSSYAISARGFNNAIGNKLQVLIDGVRCTHAVLGRVLDTPDVFMQDVSASR